MGDDGDLMSARSVSTIALALSAVCSCGGATASSITVTVNVTVNYPVATCTTAAINIALSGTAAWPATGWNAQACKNTACSNGGGARCCGCCACSTNTPGNFPATFQLANVQEVPGTVYVFAYDAESGGSSGPGPTDPKGSTTIAVAQGTFIYNATISLQ